MLSDKSMGAGNQQERLDAKWVVGFVDGEGCFHIGINRQPKMRMGWQVLPEFRLVQHCKDEQILKRVQLFFNCGSVGINNGDRMEFRVRGIKNLTEIVEFFIQNPLHTKKEKDFEKFAQVIDLMRNGKHLTKSGLCEIAQLALEMNRRQNSAANRILRDYMPNTENSSEDIVRSSWRHEEATRNRVPPLSNQRS